MPSIAILFPLYIALSTSLKEPAQVFAHPYAWIPNPIQWSNFFLVFTLVPLWRSLFNSFVQSSMTTIAVMFTSALAAFAFVYRFRWETVFLPPALSYNNGVRRSYRDLKLSSGTTSRMGRYILGSYGTFFCCGLRQFFLQIPRELYDAAVVDGCGRLRHLFDVIIPISRAVLGTLAVYTYLFTWNRYFWPPIFTNRTF